MGVLAAGNGISAEKIIMDHDIIEVLNRVQAGMRVDDETIAFESVARVGIGGDFMMDELTSKLLRSGEYYFGGSFDHPVKAGEEVGWHKKANDRVEQILATHKPAVPDSVRQEIEKYVSQYKSRQPV